MNTKYYETLAAVWSAMVAAQPITPGWCKVMLKVANGLVLDEVEEKPEPKPEPEPRPAAKPKQPRKRIDWGKVGACYKAGWSAEKIADEVGATVGTIRQGISTRKWETYEGEDNEQED